jgi:hypothetical protein
MILTPIGGCVIEKEWRNAVEGRKRRECIGITTIGVRSR